MTILKTAIKIMTLNVNGIQNASHTLVEKYFLNHHVVLLQETKFPDQRHIEDSRFHVDRVVGQGNYLCFINDKRHTLPNGTKTYPWGGVVTYVHKDFPGFHNITQLDISVPNRYLVIKTQWNDKDIYIHNVYAPVNRVDKAPFFTQLPTDFPNPSVHMAFGDFNLPMTEHLDSACFSQHHDMGRHEFIQWTLDLQLTDIWRMDHPETLTYSGPTRQNRLDYGLVDTNLADHTQHYSSYFEPVHGDHLALSITIEPRHTKRGRTKWKFPRELAKDAQYRAFIEKATFELLRQWNTTPNLNLGISWLQWKKQIRWETKQYYKMLKTSRRMTMSMAQNHKIRAKRALVSNDITQEQYHNISTTYNQIRTQYHEYNMDQRFDFHATQMESSTRSFYRKPRDRITTQTIHQVRDTSGNMQSTQEGIEAAFIQHWSKIMNKEETPPNNQEEEQQKMWRHIESTLCDEDRRELEDDLTPADFAASIQNQANNKSPGPDGFAAEFYKISPNNFGSILHKLYQYQFGRQSLLKPQQTSLVTLLPKSTDGTNTGNYRPIALIPLEVKILTKIFTHKLKHIIPKLVHHKKKASFTADRCTTTS
ncbi:hypothetical protein AeRB84_016687 [Aphanomyces euteiches]|nr:hypothetical protein AeRB84_016687 [Aphanomyces euteiches]